MGKMDGRLQVTLLRTNPSDKYRVMVGANDDGPPLPVLVNYGLRQIVTGIYTGTLTAAQLLEVEALECVYSISASQLLHIAETKEEK